MPAFHTGSGGLAWAGGGSIASTQHSRRAAERWTTLGALRPLPPSPRILPREALPQSGGWASRLEHPSDDSEADRDVQSFSVLTRKVALHHQAGSAPSRGAERVFMWGAGTQFAAIRYCQLLHCAPSRRCI